MREGFSKRVEQVVPLLERIEFGTPKLDDSNMICDVQGANPTIKVVENVPITLTDEDVSWLQYLVIHCPTDPSLSERSNQEKD